jgi:uncharacterized protein (DUF302 family)
MAILLTLGVTLIGFAALAAEGLVTRRSAHSVEETVSRLEAAVRDRDLMVIAKVDHAGAAQKAGLTLRPTQLLMFGHPKSGTPLMGRAQPVGIDLPLKALVWQDDQGQVWLAYNAPAWIAARHGIKEPAQVLQAMASTLEALADAATRP